MLLKARASDPNSYFSCDDHFRLADRDGGYGQEVGHSQGQPLNVMGNSSSVIIPNSGGICLMSLHCRIPFSFRFWAWEIYHFCNIILFIKMFTNHVAAECFLVNSIFMTCL